VTDPVQPRPQPVVNAARVGGLVSAAFVAVGGAYFVIAQGITAQSLPVIGTSIEGAITALIAVAVYVTAVIHGKAAAEQVTPLSAPRDDRGRTLVPVDEYGRHAATAARSQPWPPELTGPHAHPSKKLGKLAPIPGRKAVPFGSFLTVAPAHPLVDVAPNLIYPMDHNDQAGDCVVAALDHALQVICALLGVARPNWTDAELLAFYRTQNPNFRSWADGGKSVDGGMVIQTFLEYLVAQGVILAFGKVDHTNEDELKAATYLGLAIVTGEVLDVAQQTQTVWDYKRTAQWGGHATCTVGYQATPDRQTVVTWGELVDVTQAFITHQLDEAWFVLTQAHVDHPDFREHFDLAGFAAAVSELTAGKVVVPVPAPQPPAPPVPAPGPAPAPLPANVLTWARQVLGETWRSKRDRTVAQELLDMEAPQ
jgi:hypothetical protein